MEKVKARANRGQHPRLQFFIIASEDENASKRVDHRIGAYDRSQTVVRSSHNQGQRLRQLLEEGRRRQGAVVAARNRTSARERGKAQSLQCRHSSAEQTQTRMRTPPMLSQ